MENYKLISYSSKQILNRNCKCVNIICNYVGWITVSASKSPEIDTRSRWPLWWWWWWLDDDQVELMQLLHMKTLSNCSERQNAITNLCHVLQLLKIRMKIVVYVQRFTIWIVVKTFLVTLWTICPMTWKCDKQKSP